MSKRRLLAPLLSCVTRQAVVNCAICRRCAERNVCKLYTSATSTRYYLPRSNFKSALLQQKSRSSHFSSPLQFDEVCNDTLDHLTEFFEEIPDFVPDIDAEYDVEYSGEVLTVTIREGCTYVINRQAPNQQIWLSSPLTGPKRYDFVDGDWKYSHDNSTLIQLLESEISKLVNFDLEFNSVRHCLLKYT